MAGRPQLTDDVIEERRKFLEDAGLDPQIVFDRSRTLYDVDVMKESFGFFNELGADIDIFNDYPLLLSFSREAVLDPKLSFLVDEIGIPEKKISVTPELFTYSLENMRSRYLHYIEKFDGDEENARRLLKNASTVLGNKTASIDRKIEMYIDDGIDFHKNYSLLEKNPESVKGTKDYLRDLDIREDSEIWYYLLLGINKDTLAEKVEYCKRENIEWEKYPRILVLGLHIKRRGKTEFGALVRRVNMIERSFDGIEIPDKLDYRTNPAVLICSDSVLRKRIDRYLINNIF